MRRFLVLAVLFGAVVLFVPVSVPAAEAACSGSTYVSGYTTSSGRWVSGYYRTCPNSSVTDNYSYRGNYNPYTGSYGSRSYSYSYSYSPPSYSYSSRYRYSYGW